MLLIRAKALSYDSILLFWLLASDACILLYSSLPLAQNSRFLNQMWDKYREFGKIE
jgi:hypothetical protein